MKNTLSILLLAILFQSCYVPGTTLVNSQQVISTTIQQHKTLYISGNSPRPLFFNSKNQIKADFSVGKCATLGLGYAITPSIAVGLKGAKAMDDLVSSSSTMAQVYDYNSDDTISVNILSDVLANAHLEYYEAGLYYYKPWPSGFIVEAGGGISFGQFSTDLTIRNNFSVFKGTETRNYKMYFAEAAAACVKKRVEIGLIARLNSYHFTERTVSSEFYRKDYNPNAASVEYGVRMGYRLGRMTLYLQHNSGLPLMNKEVGWRLSLNSAGILFRFGPKHHLTFQ